MMDSVQTARIRISPATCTVRNVGIHHSAHPVIPGVFREDKSPDNECQPVRTVRMFRVELKSVTRRGNRVRSIYYVKDSHILAARDAAVRTAGKRGLREIRVVKVTDPLLQA
ncbi:TPA: hypothetical protein KBN74_002866 [Citrobacter freundii]|nr:hypothetical protein [Citrobacter freundii]HBB4765882.1 hypothetical protein [Citrobacter freundii]